MNATLKEYLNPDGTVKGVEVTKEDGSVVVIGEVTSLPQSEIIQRTPPEDPSESNLASAPSARRRYELETDPADTAAQPQEPNQ
jgi:hypothetical protein